MDSLKKELDKLLQYFFDERTGDADIPDRTRNYLQEQLDGLKLRIVDVRGIVRFLRNDGIDIKSRFVVNPKTKTVYKVYALKNKAINNYEAKLGGRV